MSAFLPFPVGCWCEHLALRMDHVEPLCDDAIRLVESYFSPGGFGLGRRLCVQIVFPFLLREEAIAKGEECVVDQGTCAFRDDPDEARRYRWRS